MPTLLTTMVQVLAPLVPLFSERLLAHVRLLLAGAILAPGKWTVVHSERGGSATREALLLLPWGLSRLPSVKPASKPRTARVAR